MTLRKLWRSTSIRQSSGRRGHVSLGAGSYGTYHLRGRWGDSAAPEVGPVNALPKAYVVVDGKPGEYDRKLTYKEKK